MLTWLHLTKNERMGLWVVIALAIVLTATTLWIRRSSHATSEPAIILLPAANDSLAPDSTGRASAKQKAGRRTGKNKPARTVPDYNPFDHPLP